MARIQIAPFSRVSESERPYLKIQIIPDRLKYSVVGNVPHNVLAGIIRGPAGYCVRIQEHLEVLGKREKIDPNGVLFRTWLTCVGHAEDSQNLNNDQTLLTALEEFQRLACTGSSYRRLPRAAAEAAFWERTSEVTLPRITAVQHQNMPPE